MRPAIKFLLGSSSGSMRKMADFFEAKSSALMALSKQRTCSSSVSRKALRRDRTVDMTEFIDCSAVVRAAPANHRALWVSGSLSMRI